mmetsp:Transcript_3805/g.4179  ORF Transcript_3805/g.4179 Transcript_3805/m.4179 type:complete len:615 (-) Transcript_3805:133-1977(-)
MPHRHKKPAPAPIPEPMLVGEKGTLEYSSEQVGEKLVAFFFALVRNTPQERIVSLLNEVFQQAALNPLDAPRITADVFILAFQTRDCRGGKGERSIFYHLLLELYQSYPETVIALIPLIAEYGYYKDYFNILAAIEGSVDRYAALRSRILEVIVNQLKADEEALAKETGKIVGEEVVDVHAKTVSLCAKYAPRESHQFQKGHKDVFKSLVLRLFPAPVEITDEQQAYQRAKRLYRKLISRLTESIDVPEVKMCGKRYASIAFDHVPSVCLKKNRKAFANEKLKVAPKAEEHETGNRSTDPDRIECRKHLIEALKDKKVKGKQNYPHEIAHEIMHSRGQSIVELEIFQAQWEDIRNNIMQTIAEKKAASGVAGSMDLGKLVPLVDVSGSMSGIPMEVAIALGILISEVNHPLFRDQFITFESTPQWVDLSSCRTIADKVRTTQAAPWGGTTNIEKAFDLIADKIERNRLPESEIPDLIVFSDMQFDVAIGDGSTRGGDRSGQLQRIQKRFAELGKRISGHPYNSPRIIFWNLRGDTEGFPATATSDNVQMLSGFSPSLFKHLVDGSELAEVGPAGEKAKVNPYVTFRKAMDDERYGHVREVLEKSQEGYLAQYSR